MFTNAARRSFPKGEEVTEDWADEVGKMCFLQLQSHDIALVGQISERLWHLRRGGNLIGYVGTSGLVWRMSGTEPAA